MNTNIRKKRIAMDKKQIGGQPSADDTSTIRFKPSLLHTVAVYAVLSTAFWEECLFRGFLLKRLAHRFGFPAGNAVQAAIFGLMHGVMFFAAVGVLRAILVTLLTGTIGWGLGYLNEKQAGGSIFPSWAIHALSNLIAGMYAAFAVL